MKEHGRKAEVTGTSLMSWDAALLVFSPVERQRQGGSLSGSRSGAGKFAPPPSSCPTPRFAHGGSLAALMDETFSKTAYLAGEGLFTVSLNIRFKK